MQFYDRQQEIAALRKIEALSAHDAQMTVITGRRRIGKTTLIKKSFTGIPFVYFFVGKKSETLLCSELAECPRWDAALQPCCRQSCIRLDVFASDRTI